MSKTHEMLADALVRLERDPVQALELLEEVWRRTLDPSVALVAHRLIDRIVTPDEGWDIKPRERHARWMAEARAEPGAAKRLELMRHFDFKADRASDILERADVIARWKPDPIVARWLVDVFARQTRAPFLEGDKCFRRVAKLLVDWLDIVGRDRLQSFLGGHVDRIRASKNEYFDKLLGGVMSKTADRLAARELLSDADVQALAATGLVRQPEPSPQPAKDVTDLLAEIYAAPWNDAPRTVLADFLMARGDPRGEFIALQLAQQPTSEARRRARDLLKQHQKTWLGEQMLGAVNTSTLVWRRGFPAAGEIKRTSWIGPAFATFRELDVRKAGRPSDLSAACFLGVESWLGLTTFRLDHPASEPNHGAPRVRRLGVRTAFRERNPIAPLLHGPFWSRLEELIVELEDLDQQSVGYLHDLARDPGFEHFMSTIAAVEKSLPHVQRLNMWGLARFERDALGSLALRKLSVNWKTRDLFIARHSSPGWRELAKRAGTVEVAETNMTPELAASFGRDVGELTELRSWKAFDPLVD